MKHFIINLAIIAATAILSGCAGTAEVTKTSEKVTLQETQAESAVKENEKDTKQNVDQEEETILIAAAASLKKCMEDQLIPIFEEKNPGINVTGTYDSSGKLQTQIEEGIQADIFFSAAQKQMDALKEQGLADANTIVDLLENKIVFIVPKGEEGNYQSFEDLVKAESLAFGDPESVPVGQYTKEALTNLKLWDSLQDKVSLGTNVTEVLNWVAEGSAQGGVVYATDADKTDKVAIVAEAPAESVKKVIYPVGIIKDTRHREAADKFLDFLQSEDALNIFRDNGFTPAD